MPDTGPEPVDDGRPNVDLPVREVGEIVLRLQTQPTNPVTRARIRVEQEVPVARRGPGWDRHWRELEAYLESPTEWLGVQEPE